MRLKVQRQPAIMMFRKYDHHGAERELPVRPRTEALQALRRRALPKFQAHQVPLAVVLVAWHLGWPNVSRLLRYRSESHEFGTTVQSDAILGRSIK